MRYNSHQMGSMPGLGNPPPYSYIDGPRRNRFDPRGWSLKKILIAVAVVALVVIIIIAAAVVSARKNRYPDYSKLTYQLAHTYEGENFFSNFDYFTGFDPAGGFVHYVDEVGSQGELNLTYASSTSAVLRVDPTDENASTGRKSARIYSKTQYGLNTLFLFDVLHSPYGCATWPALWLTDPAHWPDNGEIDVLEAVNIASSGTNQIALHTSKGCKMSGVKRKLTGKVLSTDCWNAIDDNAGCAVQAPPESFGAAFNANGGGTYALELRGEGIRAWFFPRAAALPSLDPPNPFSWGTPLADFPNTECDMGNHFKNQSIVVNIDLCGQWAGNADVFSATCSGTGGTCEEWVAGNEGGRWDNAYWEFGGFRVYNGA